MRAIVDGTTTAMEVEVCSFYLADREQPRLTLAATNGLDRSQVGRVSLAVGQGITGRVAESREPIAVEDVTVDPRFAWVRGFDIEGLHAMLSVPLVWHDRVIGVLNVQTPRAAAIPARRDRFLRTIGALLAGIVEKGRLQAEVEARLAQLTALDAARAELLSVVTHELRTPLSVVRAYVDLLGEAAAGRARPIQPARESGRRRTGPGVASRPSRRLDPRVGPRRGADRPVASPFDAVAAVDETVETLRLLLRPHPIRWERPPEPLVAIGDETRFKQVLEQLLENESKYAPTGRRREHRRLAAGRRRSRSTSPTTGRASRSRTGRASSSRSSGSTVAAAAAAPGSGCSRLAG